MKLVTRDDIERWADGADSKGNLPSLVSRLVRATTPSSTETNFPSGSATYVGGWDGDVTCHEDTPYVPKGISLYEFGTEKTPKRKADGDYAKRKANTLGYNPKECVFIFVTPRFWKGKDKWVKEKQAEGFWKNVKVYDSSNLEQWFDLAPAVSRWFSSHIGKYPSDNIMEADEFWKEWSTGPNGLVLLPEVILSGRESEQEQLSTFLKGKAGIIGIKASTKNESIAFIIAAAKKFPQNESDIFFSKSLIVDTEGNFRGIRINEVTPLNLIPRFDETQPLMAASEKHHVFVPLGADDDFNQITITLPTIDRDGQINSLIQRGLSRDDAEKFSRESGRNITILKKMLKFPYSKAAWIDTENIREIIPVLLLGRWDENFTGDIELIEKLAEQPYSDYLITLNKWKNLEESPIIQIGETWRLTSPLDLWTNLSSNLTQKDFQNIQDCFSLVFKNGIPSLNPKDKNDFAVFFNNNKKYSDWSREGLVQSLILIGSFGGSLNVPNFPTPQFWVDNIIFDLLNNASGEIWISINHELPLIAEASPVSFLKAVSNSLLKEQPEIMESFKEVDGFLHPISNHTGLLWALEGLAWFPEYLQNVSLIFLQLSRLDPGGRLLNRPLNCISEIFKPWYYQTLASYDERMEILKFVTEKEKESGWELLIKMLPEFHGNAQPTYKMRWRMFSKNVNLTYTYQEIWNTHTCVVKLLLDLFDNNENKFSQLIDKIGDLSPDDRKIVLDWADTIYPNVEQREFTAWKLIREILYRHRSHPEANWVLPESELVRLEDLYNKLQPTDIINKYIWIFNDSYPAFTEGFNELKEYDQRLKKIDDTRYQAALVFLSELGLKRTLELRKQVKMPWALGDTLAKIIVNQEDVLIACECLNDDTTHLQFIQGFILRKSIINGFEWIKTLITNLKNKNFSSKAISTILIPIGGNKQFWKFLSSLEIDIQNEYWQNIPPGCYNLPIDEKVMVVEMMLKYKRFFSGITICFYIADAIPTNLLTELLKKAMTEYASEPLHFEGYEIEAIFETLDKRTDLEKSIMTYLEWLYLPLLSSYGTSRKPKHLEEELSKNPEFFIDVLKLIYVPQDKVKSEEEKKNVSDEVIQDRVKRAYSLLQSWKKIPGMKEDNSIDEVELKEWIKNVRTLAKDVSRLDVADAHIGQILAQYPENISQWPQEKIFQIIEEINTDRLKRNYSISLFNKRGLSSRSPFDGGIIEREKADYFGKLSNDFKNKYPNVAEIFKHLEQTYLADAKQMDEDAERDKLEY